MRNFAKFALLVVVCMSGAGCIPKNLDRDAVFRPDDRDAVFVIGVEPRYRVTIYYGNVKDGVFDIDPLRNRDPVFLARPEDGFLVGRVTPGEEGDWYGITKIQSEKPNDPLFAPCHGVSTAVFRVKPGQLVYPGSITYFLQNKTMRPIYSSDPVAARKFISRNYPGLKAELEVSDFKIMKAEGVWCYY